MLELYAAIWRISARRQIALIFLAIAIAALAAAPLEFQRDIINHLTEAPINQQAEPGAGTEQLLWLGAGMASVILLSIFLKWVMGYRAGTLGEDAIRLIRKRLLGRASELETKGEEAPRGALVSAVSSEAEELGKFAGRAFADPVVQIGTLISVIGYISYAEPRLGLIAAAMIVPQIVIVLVLQSNVNLLVAERVRVLRASTNQLTDGTIDAVIRSVYDKFDEVYEARRRMFVWKLSAKFLLSAINGAGIVGVLMLGGWLVLRGETDVGALVAATVGLARIQGPTTYLIAFYRQVSANRIKFELLSELLGAGHHPKDG